MQDNVEDVTGDLTDLETTDKSNLVGAINEAQTKINTKFDKTSVKDTYSTSTTDTYGCDYINELETYSTSETRIGTWIDGRPLYRIVLAGTLPTGSGKNDFYIDNHAQVRSVQGFVKSTYSQWWAIPGNYSSDGYNIYLNVGGDSGADPTNKISVECGSYYSTSSRYFIIVEYTKTTDV